MEVQGRVVRDHASNAGGESVRSPPRQSPPHPPTVLCDQVTVKLIVLVEYSYWHDNGCSRVYLRMEDMFASIHCINFTWSVVFRRWRREGEGWLSQCNQAQWSYPPEIQNRKYFRLNMSGGNVPTSSVTATCMQCQVILQCQEIIMTSSFSRKQNRL